MHTNVFTFTLRYKPELKGLELGFPNDLIRRHAHLVPGIEKEWKSFGLEKTGQPFRLDLRGILEMASEWQYRLNRYFGSLPYGFFENSTGVFLSPIKAEVVPLYSEAVTTYHTIDARTGALWLTSENAWNPTEEKEE